MTIWDTICRKKQREANVFDLTAVGIGRSLAVGAFVVFGDLIKNVTGPAVLFSLALAGAAALFGGICFTELGVQFLKADSAYVFSYSFGQKHVAFMFGWALLLQYIAGAASVGKGIVTFIDALTENKISNFMKNTTATNFQIIFVYFDFLSVIIIVTVFIILALRIKDNAVVRNVFTICNIILVVFVLITGSFKVDVNNWHTDGSEDEKSSGGFLPFGILGVTKGAAIAFYGFVGFDNIGVSGNEVKSRKKSLPIAVTTTVIFLFLAYTGIGTIVTLITPYNKLNEHAVLPLAFEQLGSTTTKWVVTIATFFGFLTSLIGVSFPLPRIIQAMASDGLLFGFLHNKSIKITTSKTAILFSGLLSGAATGILSFRLLVSLTVLGALSVYTIIAINVILTRYFRKSDSENPEFWTTFDSASPEISIKTTMKNCFSSEQTTTNKFIEKFILGNTILYCLSSVGLSVTYSVFSDPLFKGSVEAVVPACIFLCITLLSLFSLIRQPKLQTVLPFEVPSVPLLPCLSIFLNVFLMTTFDSITWLLFSGWMVLGVFFHLVFQCLNACTGNVGKESLYEINKSNVLKLNEAIWKINSEKKNFYEGAINPVFSDESENTLEEVKSTIENEIKVLNEKALLQLKQAEIIQTAETIMEERAVPLENKPGPEYLGFNGNSLEENNSVHWECVAEIHTEEEFPEESIVLEIVDNTYNFLGEVSEESPKDNISQKSGDKFGESIGSVKDSKLDERRGPDVIKEVVHPPPIGLIKDMKKQDNSQNSYKNLQFQDELLSKIRSRIKTAKEKSAEADNVKEKISKQLDNSEECQNEDELVNFVIETLYEAPKSEMNSRSQKKSIPDGEKPIEIPEEHNRIKEFKEKLNQLLKNQINNGKTPEKPVAVLKSDTEDELRDKKRERDLFESIRTLNKTQIRGKLEVLLAKGPPKRPSFRNQFMKKAKEDEKSDELEEGIPSNKGASRADFVEVDTLSSNTDDRKSLNNSAAELRDGACS